MVYVEGGKQVKGKEKEEVKVRKKEEQVVVTFEEKLKEIGKGWLPSVNIVLVGQVDHGKSTLLGRLLKQCNL
jgi:GTPase